MKKLPKKPLVSIDWLFNNLNHKNIIVLNGTIPKVGTKNAPIKL